MTTNFEKNSPLCCLINHPFENYSHLYLKENHKRNVTA